MKFKDIIYEWLLVENKEQIYTKYYSDIPRNLFIRLITADPKTIVNNNVIIQFGKHSRLILELYKKNELKIEDLPKATEYLNIVYNENLSINYANIKNLFDLFELVKDYIPKVATTLEQILGVLDKKEYSIVMNTDTWIIIEPKSEKAAAYIGINTEWCTTWGKYCFNPKLKDRTNRYAYYSSMGPFYIIINKNDINDKYQIHFESNQLTLPSNKEVPYREQFFNERSDVKKFFFPSLFEPTDNIEQIKEDLKKAKNYLSKKDVKTLMTALFEYYGRDGNGKDLLSLLIAQDVDGLEMFINDETIKTFDFYKDVLHISVRTFPQKMSEYLEVIGDYRAFSREAYDHVYENENDQYRSSAADILDSYLESYYEKRKGYLIDNLGNTCKTYETFYDTFFEDISEDDNIKDDYLSEYSTLTSSSLKGKVNEEINRMTSHLDYENRWTNKEIQIPVEKIIEYVSKNEIVFIDNLSSFIEEYCEFFDLPTNSESLYYDFDYQYEYPTQEFMDGKFDDFFDKMIETMGYDPETEEILDQECTENRKKFLDITKKYFNEYNVFENDFVKISVNNNWHNDFSCQEGVYVTYENKKTNEKYNGYMKVDNIINYITMEPLFEHIAKKIVNGIKKKIK